MGHYLDFNGMTASDRSRQLGRMLQKLDKRWTDDLLAAFGHDGLTGWELETELRTSNNGGRSVGYRFTRPCGTADGKPLTLEVFMWYAGDGKWSGSFSVIGLLKPVDPDDDYPDPDELLISEFTRWSPWASDIVQQVVDWLTDPAKQINDCIKTKKERYQSIIEGYQSDIARKRREIADLENAERLIVCPAPAPFKVYSIQDAVKEVHRRLDGVKGYTSVKSENGKILVFFEKRKQFRGKLGWLEDSYRGFPVQIQETEKDEK